MADQNPAGPEYPSSAPLPSAAEQAPYEMGYPLPLPDKADILPPGQGHLAYPHFLSFASIVNLATRTYRYTYDEAIKDSFTNSLAIRRDPIVYEGMRSRQVPVAQLPWHLEASNDQDPWQAQAVQVLSDIIDRIPRFQQLCMQLLEAVYYGRYGSQLVYGWDFSTGRKLLVVRDHKPINGDKLVFRYSGQAGVLVHSTFAGPWEVSDRGRVHFFTSQERETIILHRHEPEDADFFEGELAGGIQGVGLRSRIYYLWKLKNQVLAIMMDYLERVGAGGFTVYYYDAGNPTSLAEVTAAAQQQFRNNTILFPRYRNSRGVTGGPGVERVEAGVAGAELLRHLVMDYFDETIRRTIGGSRLTREGSRSLIGSADLANLDAETEANYVKYDAVNLQETFTAELVSVLQRYNFPMLPAGAIRFKYDVDKPNTTEVLEAAERFFNMGGTLDEDDTRTVLGLPAPEPGHTVLSKMGNMQAEMAAQVMMTQPGEGAEPPPGPPPPGGPSPVQSSRRGRPIRFAADTVTGAGQEEFAETDPGTFLAARAKAPRGPFLSSHSEDSLSALQQQGGKLYLHPSGHAGYALTADGDLQNVFNSGKVKGLGGKAVSHAITNGATTLDAFDGFLPQYYSKFGFKEYKREPWNDQYAPQGWDYNQYGRPDVVYMRLDRPQQAEKKAGPVVQFSRHGEYARLRAAQETLWVENEYLDRKVNQSPEQADRWLNGYMGDRLGLAKDLQPGPVKMAKGGMSVAAAQSRPSVRTRLHNWMTVQNRYGKHPSQYGEEDLDNLRYLAKAQVNDDGGDPAALTDDDINSLVDHALDTWSEGPVKMSKRALESYALLQFARRGDSQDMLNRTFESTVHERMHEYHQLEDTLPDEYTEDHLDNLRAGVKAAANAGQWAKLKKDQVNGIINHAMDTWRPFPDEPVKKARKNPTYREGTPEYDEGEAAKAAFSNGQLGVREYIAAMPPGHMETIDGNVYLSSMDGPQVRRMIPTAAVTMRPQSYRNPDIIKAIRQHIRDAKGNVGTETSTGDPIEPISVVPNPKAAGQWRVFDGHHRLDAYEAEGEQEIPAWTPV